MGSCGQSRSAPSSILSGGRWPVGNIPISRLMKSLLSLFLALLIQCLSMISSLAIAQETSEPRGDSQSTSSSPSNERSAPAESINESSAANYPASSSKEARAILRRHCTRCHGEKRQEADLRLDQLESIIIRQADSKKMSGDPATIVAGNAAASHLIHRLVDPDQGDIMPLDGNPLSSTEIATLQKWIQDGAIVSEADRELDSGHWSYQQITRPTLPEASKNSSAIDYFIGNEHRERGLSFSVPEQPGRLLRRVSLALTGVPPSPEAVNRFLSSPSIESYSRFVDDCLDSPRYGERWAVHWLDLARYADSNGFQADQIRDNWAYRDWVIRSFNRSQPFDQFITDQIAGDLVENPSLDQQVATGFHRMTTCNVEAGVDPEANRVNQVVDRVNTTATVFLGSTLECAQCHDHKYDPFSQKDYYRLFAYFNNTSIEVKNTSGVTWDFYGPTMDLPMNKAKTEQLASLEVQVEKLQSDLDKHQKNNQKHYLDWIAKLSANREAEWQIQTPSAFETTGTETFEILADGSVLLSGPIPDKVEYTLSFDASLLPVTAIRVEALTDDQLPGQGPGRGDPQRTNIILSEVEFEQITKDQTSVIALINAQADFSQAKWEVAKAIDGDPKTGWAIAPQFGKPHWASFVVADPSTTTNKETAFRLILKQFYGSGRVIGKPRVSFYHGDPELLGIDSELIEIASKEKKSPAENKRLREAFDQRDATTQSLKKSIADLKKQVKSLKPDTTLVMQEDTPRETFVMIRGDYESLGPQVSAGIPSILESEPSAVVQGNRLDLARWLTSATNPLTARVVVNQWWSEIFGRGLVSTPEDFGTQGERPTHPELLDWLASELIDSGWSMKHIHKLMVTSLAFRQSSASNESILSKDPNNLWLARAPRLRMKAEFIRDNGLTISGLLSTKQEGPPIMPYQPDNLWRSVGRNQPKWIAAENEDRFRRGVYVVWKRAAPYPSFVNFDAPNRGACTVERGRSNTPLQALTLLNDPAYVEMALAFADRIISESPSSDDGERIKYAFQIAIARTPSNDELSIVSSLLAQERNRLKDQPALIKERIQGPSSVIKLRSSESAELAAWMSVANALLNLDETMSR